MRPTIPALLLTTSAALFGISVARAQNAAPTAAVMAPVERPAFKNLQVFPKDIPRQELLSRMRFFSQSLGVRCTFCHVGVDGQPPSTYDFASDAKKEKMFARKMLLMVARINTQDFAAQAWTANAKVTCFTCHRGAPRPLTTPPPEAPKPPAAAPGTTPPPGPPRPTG